MVIARGLYSAKPSNFWYMKSVPVQGPQGNCSVLPWANHDARRGCGKQAREFYVAALALIAHCRHCHFEVGSARCAHYYDFILHKRSQKATIATETPHSCIQRRLLCVYGNFVSAPVPVPEEPAAKGELNYTLCVHSSKTVFGSSFFHTPPLCTRLGLYCSAANIIVMTVRIANLQHP